MIKTTTNIILKRAAKKPLLIDSCVADTKKNQPLIIFCHGYKGYKDWGGWSLMANAFAKSGFAFVKFNFSHNGGTIKQPIDFPDLEAFGHNNYSKELDDLGDIINWCISRFKDNENVDTNHLCLIGHSRGGGIVLLKAAEDSRIKQVVSLAGVSDYKSRFPTGSAFKHWKSTGVYYIKNGRTLQDMPHYFQYYEDFVANEERLSISKAAMSIKCPYLIVHGTADEAVKHEEAERLHSWCRHSQLLWLEGANHVFGMKQPWKEPQLPKEMVLVLEACYRFLS